MDKIEIKRELSVSFTCNGYLYMAIVDGGVAYCKYKHHKVHLYEIDLNGFNFFISDGYSWTKVEETEELYQEFMENLASRLAG